MSACVDSAGRPFMMPTPTIMVINPMNGTARRVLADGHEHLSTRPDGIVEPFDPQWWADYYVALGELS